MTMRNTIKSALGIGAAAAAAALPALALTACDATTVVKDAAAGAQQAILGKDACETGPTVYLLIDTSGSTEDERKPGGLYEAAARRAAIETAKACGELFAAPIAGNALAASTWTIDGKTFRQTVGGNAGLGEAARERKTQELWPEIRDLLRTRKGGTDILGGLQRVVLAHETQARKGSPTTSHETNIILLSDGVITVPGHFDLYKKPLTTTKKREAFVERLRRGGELPDLTGVELYLAGVGIGVSNRETAKSIVATWQALAPAMGAELGALDTTLRFP